MHLTFTTTIDKTDGKPLDYFLEGMLTHEGETFPVGLSSTCFNRAFDEMIYWLHTIESVKDNQSVKLTFNTKEA
jgi:hypothetical protein